jgi:hypothetical protein
MASFRWWLKILYWWIFVWGHGGFWSFFGVTWFQDIFRSWNVRHCLSGWGLRHFGLFRLLFEGVYDWSGRFIGVKFAHSVIKAGASVPKLSIHNRVKLFWVPGHCGIIGNEEADGLAGSKSTSAGRNLVCPYQSHWWHVWQKNGCQIIIFLTGIW